VPTSPGRGATSSPTPSTARADGCGDDNYGRFAGLFGRRISLPEVVVDPSFSFLTNKLPWVERMALIDSSSSRRTRARNPDGGFGYGACSPSTEELAFVPSPSGSPPPGHLLERRRRLVDGERRAFTFLMFDPAVSSHFRLVQLWQGAAMMEGVEEAAEVEGMHIYTSETGAWSDRYGTPSNVDKSNRTIRW
jgi:predicted transcriptional regulator